MTEPALAAAASERPFSARLFLNRAVGFWTGPEPPQCLAVDGRRAGARVCQPRRQRRHQPVEQVVLRRAGAQGRHHAVDRGHRHRGAGGAGRGIRRCHGLVPHDAAGEVAAVADGRDAGALAVRAALLPPGGHRRGADQSRIPHRRRPASGLRAGGGVRRRLHQCRAGRRHVRRHPVLGRRLADDRRSAARAYGFPATSPLPRCCTPPPPRSSPT